MTKFEQMADCLNNFVLSAGVDTVVSTSLISLYVTIRESMVTEDFAVPVAASQKESMLYYQVTALFKVMPLW